ncbi:MAG: long-chain fatty acid--CoA ligase [Anaerolineae bacterium]|nr:long-chain fatty acid--CoA ligase [Anaerolineae bacterium]
MEKPWLDEYDSGVPATIDYPEVPVHQFLLDAAAKYPNHRACIFGNVVEPLGNRLMDTTMSYKELLELTQRFAAALQGLGVKKGDRVAVHLPNCPQFIIAYYATSMVGGIVVPCNPQYVPRELRHQLTDSGAKVAVTLSLTYPLIKQVRSDTALEHVVVTNIKEYFPGLLKFLFTVATEKKEGHFQDISGDANTYWFQELLAQAASQPEPVTVTPADTGVLMYTGGTTGVSKGAQLTHKNLVANALQVRWWMVGNKPGQEVMMTALPLFHSYAMTVCMNHTVYLAGTMILIPNPRVLDHVLKSINKHKPTLFPGVPAMYVSVSNHPEIGQYDVSSIRACISGAAGLPPEVQESFESLTGGKLVEGYGLSEATPVTHCNPIYGKRKEGSWIGVPFPDTLAVAMDLETGEKRLETGEIGELCVQGPQVMKGYWNMPTETANSLREHESLGPGLWLHTGDITRMDTDGFFQIVDRKKDMILGSGGYNIYPREVEDVLYEHPKVLEAAVAGVPVGAEKGERVKAYVVLKPGESATEEEILEYCRENLAYYKVPKFVEFRSELPKTMVGKILRRVLIEEELKRMGE